MNEIVRRSATTENKYLSAAVALTCFDTLIICDRCDKNMSEDIKKNKISKENKKYL